MRKSGRVFWVSIACVLLAIGLVCGVVGCGSGDGETTETTAATTETTAATTETTAATTETSAAGATDVIKIGIVEPLTGTPIGQPWQYGMELLFDKVNEEGGVTVNGTTYTFEYYVEDDKMTVEGAATAATKLVDQIGVDYIFGGILDLGQAAVYDIAEKKGVMHLCAVNVPGGDQDVSPSKPLLARIFISCDSVWAPDLDYLTETWPDVKTMTIVVRDQGYEDWLARFKPLVESYGIEVLDTVFIPMDATDYVPTYTKAIAGNPDVIVAFASHSAGDEFQAARSLGYKGVLVGTSPLGAEVIKRAMDPEYCDNAFCNGDNPENPTALMQEVMDRWAEKWPNEQWVSDAFMGYDGAWVLVQAIEKAQSVEQADVMAALETMINEGDVQTVHGPARMGGKWRLGVDRVLVRPIPMTRFIKGEMVTEKYVIPAVGEE